MPSKEKSQKNSLQISIKELKELLLENLNALWSGQDYLCSKFSSAPFMIPPIMIWGAPGVGKSTVIRELTKELGIGFIDVRLAQREPVDMRGLPVPENDRVKWLVSSEWPRDPQSRGIIIFDELTSADKTLQVASYEFILDRRLGDLYTVPPGWYIVAAGNRVEDKAVSCAMSSALANRFLHVEINPDADSFLRWAQTNGVHQSVINFIRYRPKLLFATEGEELQRGWPSPRSWERVSTMVKIAEHNNNCNTLKYTVPGLVGQGAAVEFLTFYKNMCYSQGGQDIKVLLLNGTPIEVPSRADQIYACCGAVAYYLTMEKSNDVFKRMLDGFFDLCMRLSNDFSQMLLSDVLGKLGENQRKRQLLAHPAYAQWTKKIGLCF